MCNVATHETKFEMARMLLCSLYFEKDDNRFCRNLFEYVYWQKAEEVIGSNWVQTVMKDCYLANGYYS